MRVLSVFVLGGCIVSSHIGPGVMTNMQAAPRDPDPTRIPNQEQTTSPWVPESEAAKPGTRRYEAERGLATIAAVLAGAVPMLTWYGTFDENLLGPKRARRTVKRTSEPPPPVSDWWPPKPATPASPPP